MAKSFSAYWLKGLYLCLFPCDWIVCSYPLFYFFYWNMHLLIEFVRPICIRVFCFKQWNAVSSFPVYCQGFLDAHRKLMGSCFPAEMNILRRYLLDHRIIWKARKLVSENRAALGETGQRNAQTKLRKDRWGLPSWREMLRSSGTLAPLSLIFFCPWFRVSCWCASVTACFLVARELREEYGASSSPEVEKRSYVHLESHSENRRMKKSEG